jgi:hypothetical protein
MVLLLSSIAALWAAGAIASPLQARADPKTYEAEDAVLSGTVVEKTVAGFTGTLS